MRFREAKKLHNGDEVTIKATNEVVEVMPCNTEKELFDKVSKILEGIYQ